MGATVTRMTAEQYYEITVEGDGKQLVEGEIVVNEPNTIHAHLQMKIAVALGSWVDTGPGRGLALFPTGIVMDDHNVFGPDVLWFSEQRKPPLTETYPECVPDLCVEIRSPGTWRYDVGAKKAVYERGGLPELWLVDDAADTVLVFAAQSPPSGASTWRSSSRRAIRSPLRSCPGLRWPSSRCSSADDQARATVSTSTS